MSHFLQDMELTIRLEKVMVAVAMTEASLLHWHCLVLLVLLVLPATTGATWYDLPPQPGLRSHNRRDHNALLSTATADVTEWMHLQQ